MWDASDQRESEGLAAILAEYLTQIDRGQPVSREALLAKHPGHVAALRSYFADVDLIEQLAQGKTNFNVAAPGTPREFGAYDLLREVGRGGMGIIYQARERTTGRLVALKMLIHGLFRSSADVLRFRNEANTAAALRHPNIVPIYHVGEHEGHLFYTMPLITGMNLAQRLADGPLSGVEAARLLLAVSEAVAFAHTGGVIHRDLKPANVLLDEHNSPHVADFGLARHLGDEPLGITATGDLLGTPNYMAPEQVNSCHALIGPTTDVYAMGAILYAMLAGQPPFQSETVAETLQKICTIDPMPLRQINRRVPRDLETICLKCLEKSPASRYDSANALADELRRFLAGEPLRARPVSRLERGRRWFVRNPVIGMLTVGIAVALLAGTAISTHYAIQSSRREQQALANLYAADMNLAQQHVRAGAVASAINLLERHRPPSGDMSTAPWEWRHLWHQCHGELRRFEGPHGAVYSTAFSPDGRTVAAAGADKTVWIWETATGNVKLKLQGHTATVRDLAFAPDGKRLVTVGDDVLGIVWDTTTGERVATLTGHERPLTAVAFSADGRWIATGGNGEANVNLWDPATGDLVQSLVIGPAESLAFAPHDARFAIGSGDGFVRVCQLDIDGSWTIANTIRAHANIVRDVAWSPDGKWLATAGADYLVKLWDTHSLRELSAVGSFKEQVYSISFSPDSRRLVMAARYEPLKVWDFKEQHIVAQLLGHTALATSVEYSPDGWRLVSASEDGSVRLWDAAQSADHDRLEGHRGHVRTVAFSPGGDVLASGGVEDGWIILWNSVTGTLLRVIRSTGISINDLAYSPDGRYLAFVVGYGESIGRVLVWDVAANRAILDSPLDSEPLVSIAWAPDGTRLAVKTLDGTSWLIDAISGQKLASCSSPRGPWSSIAFSNRGELLVTAGGDNSVRVWRSDTLSQIRELAGHSATTVSALFDPQSSLIASSSSDHTIRIWDTSNGKHVRTLSAHDGTPLAIAFNADGTRLVSSSTDQTVKIWDVATGLELQSLVGHTDWVRDIAFTRDGQHLASVGYDGFVRVWHAPTDSADWATTREAAALIRHLATRFSAREPLLAAISADTSISEAVRSAAIDQAREFLFYWSPMLAGHRAADRGDWPVAIAAFQRVTALAPEDAMHWNWLALASLAGDRLETYERACDELLRRCGANASIGDLSLTLRDCLITPQNDQNLARLETLQDTYASYFPRWHSLRWLCQLRKGTIPPEFLDPVGNPTSTDPGPADWVVQAMAWHKAGNSSNALSAYQAAMRQLRVMTPNWEEKVIYDTLRREVEELLGIESPSQNSDLPRRTPAIGSPSSVPLAGEAARTAPIRGGKVPRRGPFRDSF